MHEINPSLSGPGLRTFEAVCDRWGLAPDERRRLLGDPLPDLYRDWHRLASQRLDHDLALPQDALQRIAAVLAIHSSVATLYQGEELEWLRGRFDTPPFDGHPPLALITSGRLEDLVAVLDWLAAAGQGWPIPPNTVDRQ